ncbi:hypothetical protein JOM56_003185 [Amanita muscaria]
MYKWFRLRTASRNRAFYRTLLFLFTIAVCRAVLVNRTIDNIFGDPVTDFVPIYQPQDMWKTCPGAMCGLRLDKAKAFDGTWNFANYEPMPGWANVTVTLQFTGVAIWVFFILLDFHTSSTGSNNTNANITLDGQHAGTFSHYPDNTTDLIYNATIFYTSGLANTSHELVIGATQDYTGTAYPLSNWLIFDWAIYTVDLEPSASQSASSSTSVPSTTTSSSTASTTPIPQGSSSKIGIIVGSALGGLVAITLLLVVLAFLVQRLRRAPPVKAEGVLDIDVPPHHQPYRKREIPVSVHEPAQSKVARLREARQRELDERILSTQHELDNLGSLRNARSADETSDPSAAGPSQLSPELALLRNEMQQLRDRMDYLRAQRGSDWAQGLSNEPLPPAYSQLSNDVQ